MFEKTLICVPVFIGSFVLNLGASAESERSPFTSVCNNNTTVGMDGRIYCPPTVPPTGTGSIPKVSIRFTSQYLPTSSEILRASIAQRNGNIYLSTIGKTFTDNTQSSVYTPFSSVIFSGTCSELNKQVRFTVTLRGTNRVKTVNTNCSRDGTYSTPSISFLASEDIDGSYLLGVSQTNRNGTGTASRLATKDTLPPSAPSLSLSSTLSNQRQNPVELTIRGATATAAYSYLVVRSSDLSGAPNLVGSATLGTRSFFPTTIRFAPTTDGDYFVWVSVRDAALNWQAATLSAKFTLDTRAPSLSISSPIVGARIGQTTSISGTCDESNRSVVISSGAVQLGSALCSSVVSGAPGTWSLSNINISNLADGPLTLTAKLSDLAGNIATQSVAVIKSTFDCNSVAIRTAADLNLMRQHPSCVFNLQNDLDLAGVDFKPISEVFTGTFDGKSYTIRNLNITSPDQSSTIDDSYSPVAAFFSESSNAKFLNLNFDHANIANGRTSALLVGRDTGSLFKTIVLTNAEITGTRISGGLIGMAQNTVADSIIVQGRINVIQGWAPPLSNHYHGSAGGIIGDGSNIILSNSTFAGSVNGDLDGSRPRIELGGLIGSLWDLPFGAPNSAYLPSWISDLNSTPSLTASIIYHNSSMGDLSYNRLTCYTTGTYHSNTTAGGIVGLTGSAFSSAIDARAIILEKNSYVGTIRGVLSAGGVIGVADSEFRISDSYSAPTFVNPCGYSTIYAGIVGSSVYYTSSLIRHTYSNVDFDSNSVVYGSISGILGLDGLGGVQADGTYYNSAVAPYSNGFGSPRTLAQLKTASNYVGWSPSIWNLVDGSLPTLK